jgi:hypothetical protein
MLDEFYNCLMFLELNRSLMMMFINLDKMLSIETGGLSKRLKTLTMNS